MYVCGQVVEPGVYELKNTSRLYEAVQAAGGMTETAADTYLNQARELKGRSENICPVQRRSTGVSCPFAGGRAGGRKSRS